ncbi:hypothetical protein GCM10009624_22090 [Gordonia sinesedis]
MPTAAVLIAPLRILITALGTGVLPTGNVADELTTATAELDNARRASRSATAAVTGQWQGRGADGAATAAGEAQRATTTVADDGAEIAQLVRTASLKVRHAADQLEALLDSFERAVVALGGAVFTPAGLAALLPVAIDHVARGVQIVERTRADLAADTAAMTAIGRRTAPAEAEGPAAQPASATGTGAPAPDDGTGVAVTLPDGSVVQAPNERAAAAVRAALSQQGVPYVWGGTTPAGFDCSGFTQWAYGQAGVDLPRLAQEQDNAGVPVAQADLRPGDLAVWSGHVAMYIGNGKLIEAGDPVGISPLRTTNLDQTFEGFFRPR